MTVMCVWEEVRSSTSNKFTCWVLCEHGTLGVYYQRMEDRTHVKRMAALIAVLLLVLVAISINNLTEDAPQQAAVLKVYGE